MQLNYHVGSPLNKKIKQENLGTSFFHDISLCFFPEAYPDNMGAEIKDFHQIRLCFDPVHLDWLLW